MFSVFSEFSTRYSLAPFVLPASADKPTGKQDIFSRDLHYDSCMGNIMIYLVWYAGQTYMLYIYTAGTYVFLQRSISRFWRGRKSQRMSCHDFLARIAAGVFLCTRWLSLCLCPLPGSHMMVWGTSARSVADNLLSLRYLENANPWGHYISPFLLYGEGEI